MSPALSRCCIAFWLFCSPAFVWSAPYTAQMKNLSSQDLLLRIPPGGKGGITVAAADGKADLEPNRDGEYRIPKGGGCLLDCVPSFGPKAGSFDQAVKVMSQDRSEWGLFRLERPPEGEHYLAGRLGVFSQSFMLELKKERNRDRFKDDEEHWNLVVRDRKASEMRPVPLTFRLDWKTQAPNLRYACLPSREAQKGFPEVWTFTRECFPLRNASSGSISKTSGGVQFLQDLEKPSYVMVYVYKADSVEDIAKASPIQGFVAARDKEGRMTLTPAAKSAVSRAGEAFPRNDIPFANLEFKVDTQDPDCPVLSVTDK